MTSRILLISLLMVLWPQASPGWWPFSKPDKEKAVTSKPAAATVDKAQQALQQQADRISQLQQNTRQYRDVLNALGRMPQHTYLTGLSFSGNTIRITGLAKSNAHISSLMRMLEKEDVFELPRLHVISNTVISGVAIKKFTMSVAITTSPVPRLAVSSSTKLAVPGKTAIPEVLLDISQAGLNGDLEFRQFKPGKETAGPWFYKTPVTIRLQGGFPAFLGFVEKLSRQQRVVTIEGLKMTRSGPGKIDVELVVNVYRRAATGDRLTEPKPFINTQSQDKIRKTVSAAATRNPFEAPGTKTLTHSRADDLIPVCQARLGSERLDNIKYVGQLHKGGQVFAIIQTKQGTVYRVRRGDCLGQRGIIDRIKPDALVIKQDIQKTTGWQRYTRVIKLN